jgi:DNA repair exonuclease SbcCD ATPase subunit
MAIESVSEEYRQLIIQLEEAFRRPIKNNRNLQADHEDLHKDFDRWRLLWQAYYERPIRKQLSDHDRAEFLWKYDRCARVQELKNKVSYCEKYNKEIRGLEKAIWELRKAENLKKALQPEAVMELETVHPGIMKQYDEEVEALIK